MAIMGTNTDYAWKAIATVVHLSDERFESRVLSVRRQYTDGDCQIMIWD